MPDYTYEEIAEMKRNAYEDGYKAGYNSRLEEEHKAQVEPKKNQSQLWAEQAHIEYLLVEEREKNKEADINI